MSCEDFDGWDETFLDEAIRAEERALAVRDATQAAASDASIASYAFPKSDFSPPHELSQRFSPKRPASSDFFPDDEFEVAQFFPASSSTASKLAKDSDNDALKKDLGRLSQQLNHLQRELLEIKAERDKKDEQLKSALLKNKSKDAELISAKRALDITYANRQYGASKNDNPRQQLQSMCTSHDQVGSGFSLSGAVDAQNTLSTRENSWKSASCMSMNTIEHGPLRKDVQMDGLPTTSDMKCFKMTQSEFAISNGLSIQGTVLPETKQRLKHKEVHTKAIGVQTEASEDARKLAEGTPSVQSILSNKLLAIWESPYGTRSGVNLMSKLLVASASDMFTLFRCISSSSSIPMASGKHQSFSVLTSSGQLQLISLTESAKLQQLQAILVKVTNGILSLDVFLEALLDLCELDNVYLVLTSLRILHIILHHMLNFYSNSGKRENIVVTNAQNSNSDEEKSSECHRQKTVESHQAESIHLRKEKKSFMKLSSSNMTSFNVETDLIESRYCSLSHNIPLFEKMHHIIVQKNEENIRVEALSIMNMILMKSNPHSEREKFGSMQLFGTLMLLLQKEAGLEVQRQAVHLLFLLLNCPVLMKKFSMENKEVPHMEASEVLKDVPHIHETFVRILESLAGCLACRGSRILELKLRKLVIILLAFMASSGKPGFHLLTIPLSTKGGLSFLELIVQTLALELDAEEAVTEESHEICKKRILLMREALILLNRLASNPVYSTSVLGLLTSSRAMANLTGDVVDRICRKSRKSEVTNGSYFKEAEIVDLARVFKARFFAFLGTDIS